MLFSETVKCIIKYLHNEDNTCTIRVQLGAAQILQNDLIPILSQFPSENDLFQAVLRYVFFILIIHFLSQDLFTETHGYSNLKNINWFHSVVFGNGIIFCK